MKERSQWFLMVYPDENRVDAFQSISEACKTHSLDRSHVGACLNHPETNHSHRKFKFVLIDKRIKRKKTAMKHALRYTKKLV